MKITAQEEYGLRCLLRLARQPQGASLTIPEIAGAEGLSVAYVGKILGTLRQVGLVGSARGRAGGYTLARPIHEISVGQVLQAIGEPFFEEESYCEKHAGPDNKGICVHTNDCAMRALWRGVGDLVMGTLDKVSLAELVGPEPAIQQFFPVQTQTLKSHRTPLPALAVDGI